MRRDVTDRVDVIELQETLLVYLYALKFKLKLG
jgi:hypothetical protein